MMGGAVFTTISVQYVVLDASLFDNLSSKKWQLNIICVLIFYLAILFITSNVNISVLVSHSFFMALAFINYFVYLFRENEFIFSDLRSIGTGLSVADNYKLVLHDRGWQVLFASVVFLLVAGLTKISFSLSKLNFVNRILKILSFPHNI